MSFLTEEEQWTWHQQFQTSRAAHGAMQCPQRQDTVEDTPQSSPTLAASGLLTPDIDGQSQSMSLINNNPQRAATTAVTASSRSPVPLMPYLQSCEAFDLANAEQRFASSDVLMARALSPPRHCMPYENAQHSSAARGHGSDRILRSHRSRRPFYELISDKEFKEQSVMGQQASNPSRRASRRSSYRNPYTSSLLGQSQSTIASRISKCKKPIQKDKKLVTTKKRGGLEKNRTKAR